MAYTDINTPVIQKVTLPSGSEYYIADRELRDVVDALSDTVAGGVSFVTAWDGTSAPVVAQIPAGVTVSYNGTSYTGTLDADSATPGAFYLVKSSTTPSEDSSDVYDEYVPVGSSGSKTWEKIGDTKINLTDTVTDVVLNKATDTVIGTDATFTITQPTVTLSTGSSGDITIATGATTKHLTASATGGNVTVTKKNIVATASGGGTAWNSKDTKTVLTGVKVTADPSITISTDSSNGDVTVATGIGAGTTRYLSASASGTAVNASGDNVTALTGLGTPTTQNAVKSVSPTTKKLVVGSIIGVQTTTTTASKATQGTSQTTATGQGTASTTNTDWLKGVSVSNGSLILGAATMNTQSTTQYTFTNVDVPIKNAAKSIFATGSVTNDSSPSTETGATIVTDVAVGDTFSAVTGYAAPTTDTVVGTGSTFNVTQPTITLTANTATGTGRIQYLQSQGSATTTKLSATASGTAVGANGTASVIGSSSTFTNTQPTITLVADATAETGFISVATDINTITQPTITLADTAASGGVTFVQGVTTTKAKATATGANTAWNSKDSVTVVKDAGTSITVTKGS